MDAWLFPSCDALMSAVRRLSLMARDLAPGHASVRSVARSLRRGAGRGGARCTTRRVCRARQNAGRAWERHIRCHGTTSGSLRRWHETLAPGQHGRIAATRRRSVGGRLRGPLTRRRSCSDRRRHSGEARHDRGRDPWQTPWGELRHRDSVGGGRVRFLRLVDAKTAEQWLERHVSQHGYARSDRQVGQEGGHLVVTHPPDDGCDRTPRGCRHRLYAAHDGRQRTVRNLAAQRHTRHRHGGVSLRVHPARTGPPRNGFEGMGFGAARQPETPMTHAVGGPVSQGSHAGVAATTGPSSARASPAPSSTQAAHRNPAHSASRTRLDRQPVPAIGCPRTPQLKAHCSQLFRVDHGCMAAATQASANPQVRGVSRT